MNQKVRNIIRQIVQMIPGGYRFTLFAMNFINSIVAGVRGRIRYRRDLRHFKAAAGLSGERFSVRRKDRYPILYDWTETTGFDAHYHYHTAWAARILATLKPSKHVDISSSLMFSGIASAFVPIEFYDYRPANFHLTNLKCGKADVTNLQFPDGSIESLSCMHVMEHIGLGRYGDPIDPQGDLKAMSELGRVVAPGGTLLIVVPIGKPRIQFNAHRIYTKEMIVEQFPAFTLEEMALLSDNISEGLMINPDSHLCNVQRYGCGCFCLRKEI